MARRGLLLAMLLPMLQLWASAASAQLPDRPVRIVVPFPPGGTSDIVARILAAAAGPLLPQGALVENRSGAAGNIGTAEVARAQPDGTTLIQCTIGTCAANPFLYANPGYDLDRSFAPVILTGRGAERHVVRNTLPAHECAGAGRAGARSRHGLTFGSSGVGASNHLDAGAAARACWGWTGCMCRIAAAARPSPTSIGNRIDVFFDNLPSILPHIRAGHGARGGRRLRRPRAGTARRADLRRGGCVPQGIVIESWFGFLAPAGTPPASSRAERRLQQALGDPADPAAPAGRRGVPLGGPPERMAEQVRSETARWGEVIRANKHQCRIGGPLV
jgi:tripartite-type tricarboxylate transporter receptor subunit TctC